MDIKCENCYNNFSLASNSFCYWNPDFTLAGICSSCFSLIDNKLKIQIDQSKIYNIKKKALEKKRLYLNRI